MRMGKENDFRITLGFRSVWCGSTYGCRLIYQSGPLDKRKCKKKTKKKNAFSLYEISYCLFDKTRTDGR